MRKNKCHFWDLKLCFKKSGTKEPPKFLPLRVDRTLHLISRGGVTKDSDPKKQSQIILSSEIIVDDARYPFTMDLIIDLAYVCTSKCQGAQIRIRDVKEEDGFYVFNCTLFLN